MTSPGDVYDAIESRNGFRMRSFHRLDLGLNYKWQKGKAKQELKIGVYNAYNRKNPFFYSLSQDYVFEDGDVQPQVSNARVTQTSLFPILPSVSYSLSF